MQYVSIYVFEGADHEFDTKFGLTPSHNIYGQKIARAGCAPFFGGAGSPSNTMWPGTRPTTTPSFVLIHPTVWPNTPTSQTGQTDTQDKTDNGPIA